MVIISGVPIFRIFTVCCDHSSELLSETILIRGTTYICTENELRLSLNYLKLHFFLGFCVKRVSYYVVFFFLGEFVTVKRPVIVVEDNLTAHVILLLIC